MFDGKRSLTGLTLPPEDPIGLSKLAIEERLNWLRDALLQLDRVTERISRDPKLLAAVNSELTTAFELFVFEQNDLLRRHLSLLTPQARASTVRTVAKASPNAVVTLLGKIGSNATVARTGGANASSNAMFDEDRQHANKREVDAPMVEDLPGRRNLRDTSTATLQGDLLTRASVTKTLSNVAGVKRGAEIHRLVRELGIPNLVHFTRCENLPGILQHGLLSLAASEKKGLRAIRNDESRWDAQPDGTSLSIAFPNYRMFYKYRQITPGSDWVVLLVSARVLWEKDCAFYRYNAADARMTRQPRADMRSVQSLVDLFNDEHSRDAFLRPCDPTDPQAEVMVYEAIEPSLIEAAVFETAEVRTKHVDRLGGLESTYAGAGKGLFAPRQHALAN